MSDTTLSIQALLETIKTENALVYAKPTHRGACKHCGCFLSLNREQPTAFHRKNSKGLIEFVVIYHGKSYCRACHKFQVL